MRTFASSLLLSLVTVSLSGATLSPRLVKDINPGTYPSTLRPHPYVHRVIGNVVFFHAEGIEDQLWLTDGTEAGTHRVYDGLLGHRRGIPMSLTASGGRLFFPAYTEAGTHLFVTDGTTSGTQDVTNGITQWNGGAPCGNGKTCFAGANSEIGVTDGTAAGTSILLSTAPGPHISWAFEMTSFGGRAFFNTFDDQYGRCVSVDSFDEIVCGELWVSDGTVAGTHLFKDLNPGPYPGGAYQFFPSSHGAMYFNAMEPGTGWCRVWVTNGTPEGTFMLPAETRFSCNRPDHTFAEAGAYVYYVEAFGVIKRSRGTAESTSTIWGDQTDYSRKAYALYSGGDTLYIQTVGGLWSYRNDTPVEIATHGVSILGYLASKNRMYFAIDGDLWSTDGTVDGTQRLFALPEFGGSIGPYEVTPRQFYFFSGNGELFVSDGTEPGTHKLEVSIPVANSSTPWELHAFNHRVLFTTENPLQQMSSDGTAGGTVALTDAYSTRGSIVLHQGHAYLSGRHGHLFMTDGTPEGTKPLAEWLGLQSYFGDPPAFIGDTAIFGNDDLSTPSLMRRDADGTTTRISEPQRGWFNDFTAIGQKVLYWFYDPDQARSTLMITDGTSSGTKPLVSGVGPDSEPFPLANGAFFGARPKFNDPVSLWTTDLTAAGTRAVKTISTSGDDDLIPILAWHNLAIFAVGDRDVFNWQGEIVWRSDGTGEGTYPLSTTPFSYAIPDGDTLTLIRRKIDEGLGYGWEVWTTDGTAAGTRRRFSGLGRVMSAPFTLPDGSVAFAHLSGTNELHVRRTATNAVTVISLGDIGIGDAVYLDGFLYFGGCRGTISCELWNVPVEGSSPSDPATVRVEYVGMSETPAGRGVVFRVSTDTKGSAHPSVIASTVDGTLTAQRDYVPFSREIVFDNDGTVTLVVPLRADDVSGTVNVVLSSPVDATIAQGIATANVISADTKRRVVRH